MEKGRRRMGKKRVWLKETLSVVGWRWVRGEGKTDLLKGRVNKK